MKFTELNLPEFILKAMDKQGFVQTTEIQEKCIPYILEGKDVIGKSQTGSGKTYAYGIPAIKMVDVSLNSVQTLIVCPTRELACQVCDELRKITNETESIKIVPIYGGSNMTRQIDALKKNAKIVVGTPGRIMDHLRRKTLKLNNLKTIVLDEADEMLNMGFKEDIETILKSVNSTHQTIMFSATMPKPIMEITNQFMTDAVFMEIGDKIQLVSTIEQRFVYHDKKDALIKLYNEYLPQVGIVFCNTIRMVDEVTKLLNNNNISALGLHGDMRQSARKKNITEFKSGSAKILVGTDVAARGLDIKDVDMVINYDLPYDIEYYIHRIGRTGRAGKSGLAISLINTPSQRKQLALIEKETKTHMEQKLLSDDILMPGDNTTQSLARTQKKQSSKGSSRSDSRRGGDFKKGNRFENRRDSQSKGGFRKERTFSKSESGEESSQKRSDFRKTERRDYKADRTSRFDKTESKGFGFKRQDREERSFTRRPREDGEFKRPAREHSDFRKSDREERNFDRKPRERSFDRKPRESFGSRKPRFDSERKSFKSDSAESSRDFKSKRFGDKREYSRNSFSDKKSEGRKDFSSKKSFGSKKFGESSRGGYRKDRNNDRPSFSKFKSHSRENSSFDRKPTKKSYR